ncbi:MAG: hypothetical protein HQM10_09330 [Candidatus Riflebacteria bacterium]|nr:hypothetical protein [Candidatus Riflebacteria bacterium]
MKFKCLSSLFVAHFINLFICCSLVQAADVSISSKKEYGKINLALGIELDSSSAPDLNNAVSLFPNGGISIALRNPSPAVIRSSDFASMNSKGFRWWFRFSDTAQAQATLAECAKIANLQVIVEISRDKLSRDSLQTLKQQFPFASILANGGTGWDRNRAKNAFKDLPVPAMSGYIFNLNEAPENGEIFGDAKALFDIYFDAAGDIKGNSGISVNYPSGSALGVAFSTKGNDPKTRIALLAASITGACIVNVANQKAPIKYFLHQAKSATSFEKQLVVSLAGLLSQKHSIVWPMAIKQNGDPWDNTFFKSESNAKPLVGLVAKTSGAYFLMLANTSPDNVNLKIPVNLANYTILSSARGTSKIPAGQGSRISFLPHETMIISSDIPVTPVPPTIASPSNIPPQVDVPVSGENYAQACDFYRKSNAIFSQTLEIVKKMSNAFLELAKPEQSNQKKAELKKLIMQLEYDKRKLYNEFKVIYAKVLSKLPEVKTPLTAAQTKELALLKSTLKQTYDALIAAQKIFMEIVAKLPAHMLDMNLDDNVAAAGEAEKSVRNMEETGIASGNAPQMPDELATQSSEISNLNEAHSNISDVQESEPIDENDSTSQNEIFAPKADFPTGN